MHESQGRAIARVFLLSVCNLVTRKCVLLLGRPTHEQKLPLKEDHLVFNISWGTIQLAGGSSVPLPYLP